YEASLYAGHFGLVAGSVATERTWPLVLRWIQWAAGDQPLPEEIHPMTEHTESRSTHSTADKIVSSAAALAEVGSGVGKVVEGLAGSAVRGSAGLVGEAARALPRLTRLGMIAPGTRISLGSLLAEQARREPLRDCFLFDDRVHTNAAVDVRIDNVVRGLISAGIRPATRV